MISIISHHDGRFQRTSIGVYPPRTKRKCLNPLLLELSGKLGNHNVACSFADGVAEHLRQLAGTNHVDVAVARGDVDDLFFGTFANQRQVGVDCVGELEDVDFELRRGIEN